LKEQKVKKYKKIYEILTSGDATWIKRIFMNIIIRGEKMSVI
jgi:hypothetical protein